MKRFIKNISMHTLLALGLCTITKAYSTKTNLSDSAMAADDDSLAKDIGSRVDQEKVNTSGEGTYSHSKTSKTMESGKTSSSYLKDSESERRMQEQNNKQESRRMRLGHLRNKAKLSKEQRRENVEWRRDLKKAAQESNFEKVNELVKGHSRGDKEFKNDLLKAADTKNKEELLKVIEEREEFLRSGRRSKRHGHRSEHRGGRSMRRDSKGMKSGKRGSEKSFGKGSKETTYETEVTETTYETTSKESGNDLEPKMR